MKFTRFTIKTWIASLLVKLGLRRAAPMVVASPEEVIKDLRKQQKNAIAHLDSVRSSNLAISRSYSARASNYEQNATSSRAAAAHHYNDASCAESTMLMIQSSLMDTSSIRSSDPEPVSSSCSSSSSSSSDYSSSSCSSSDSSSSSSYSD